MFVLLQLKKFNLSKMMMGHFYTGLTKSVLPSSVTIWCALATAKDNGRLQCVIQSAEKVIDSVLQVPIDPEAYR